MFKNYSVQNCIPITSYLIINSRTHPRIPIGRRRRPKDHSSLSLTELRLLVFPAPSKPAFSIQRAVEKIIVCIAQEGNVVPVLAFWIDELRRDTIAIQEVAEFKHDGHLHVDLEGWHLEIESHRSEGLISLAQHVAHHQKTLGNSKIIPIIFNQINPSHCFQVYYFNNVSSIYMHQEEPRFCAPKLRIHCSATHFKFFWLFDNTVGFHQLQVEKLSYERKCTSLRRGVLAVPLLPCRYDWYVQWEMSCTHY